MPPAFLPGAQAPGFTLCQGAVSLATFPYGEEGEALRAFHNFRKRFPREALTLYLDGGVYVAHKPGP